ncbi:Predicted 5' DNA nuclease, flap endonuclease-1-like, helix-3-turn-helix (H3TH) domain [Sphingomonas gellani]|uniref:Predicted 5' DNA nuclease, flap endonuclease-1-like, helix-3-turn-helix (H3TH) domain n=1 Tax=Sphingomonas gellani TaxID=1166340 RepID=A0A1H8J0Z0_9SPHN|nr:hypothetical protein [Sphingomonas gellani]SEN73638.1 Predicted 5' DNA nuclease, flap endonuclease-1-like, helix-3-turn-helix (H3TH) domain [Sphingomonas gellani]
MNDTMAAAANQTSLLAGSSYGLLTGIHLGLMLVFAVLVIIAIGYGVRLKRRRVQADKEVAENAAEAGVPTQPAAEPGDSLPADARSAETPAAAQGVPRAAAPEPTRFVPVDTRDDEPGDRDDDHAEPIVAAAPLTASPAAEAASHPAPARASGPADGPVTQLKGLGPKVTARLAELGITTVGQIAALSDDQAEALDAELGSFRGRMARDRWIEQARFLAAGDRAGFESVFGKL